MTPDTILTKVKLLRNLINSPNPNEASAARTMADKLIAKYNITDEELKSLEDQPPKYGVENLLFHTFSIIGWMQHLALGIAKHFYCHIVQETLQPSSGACEYNYYVYGEDEDVVSTQFVFKAAFKKINDLVEARCLGRGPVYVQSYCEGLVESIKNNIEDFGIEIPEIKRPAAAAPQTEKIIDTSGKGAMTAPAKQEPEKPEKESVDISGSSQIKDVMAYLKGLQDGSRISFREILELEAENERVKELQSEQPTDK